MMADFAKITFLVLFISSFLFLGVSEDSEGLEILVEPEEASVGDNIVVEVFEDGESLEGAEVVSRNSLIGETDENGVLLFTPSESEELVLTVESDGDFAQQSVDVVGASVSEDSDREEVEQSATGQFVANPGNIYTLGFLVGILGGLAALMYHEGFFNRFMKFFDL